MSMPVCVLTSSEIRAHLPMSACIDLLHPAMIAISDGQAVLPLRSAMQMPGDIGMQGIMSGYLGTVGMFATKLISLFPRNAGTEHSSHLGTLTLFEAEHGYPVALFDAAEVTAIRTAAASGLATRLLARPDARTLAILGTGEQARNHVEAMLAVRPIADIRIWGRSPERAAALAEAVAREHGVSARPVSRAKDAVAGADIICTTTHASDPILHGDDVDGGTHINLVGSSIPTASEVDGPLVARSRFFVDYRDYAVNLGGEYILALHAGLIRPDHILGEIGEVAAGRIDGRTADDQITIYKSLGNAAQDIAAGHFLLQKARAEGLGQNVRLIHSGGGEGAGARDS